MSERHRIARAAGAMSGATLISRILGYVKDMILAVYFGASGLSDVFFAAFRVPNLMRELFAEGSMSSAFIPVLAEQKEKKGEEEARRLVRITFTFIIIVVGTVCALGALFAPAIVAAVAPGFLKDPSKFSLTVLLTRVMFPFLLFISLAALAMGALNVRKVFFVPALAPASLNISIILILVGFSPFTDNPIMLVAAGVAVGGFIQFAFQLPSFYKAGYGLGLDPSFRHPGLKRMAVLIIPATVGMAVNQINIIVSNILASYLAEGSITYLYYSMRLIQFPVGIFGVAMGMAVLPSLSMYAVRGEFDRLREDFSFSLRLLFFISVPAMAGLIALREPIVNLLFQRGRFDYAATAGTAEALLYYSLGIWAIVGARTVTAAFYSMQDTKTPVKVAAVALISNVILSLALIGPMRHSGLAFSNALSSMVNFTLLFVFLRRKLGRVDGRRIAKSFTKSFIASSAMGFAGWLLLRGPMWQTSGGTLLKSGYLLGTVALCLGVYLLISRILKNEEMGFTLGMLKDGMGKKGRESEGGRL